MDQTYSCKFYNHWDRSRCARAWSYMSNSDNTSPLYKLLGIGQNQCIMMSKNLITPEVCDRKEGMTVLIVSKRVTEYTDLRIYLMLK